MAETRVLERRELVEPAEDEEGAAQPREPGQRGGEARGAGEQCLCGHAERTPHDEVAADEGGGRQRGADRKSTRLNSSHGYISYAVFCLKKKKTTQQESDGRTAR